MTDESERTRHKKAKHASAIGKRKEKEEEKNTTSEEMRGGGKENDSMYREKVAVAVEETAESTRN